MSSTPYGKQAEAFRDYIVTLGKEHRDKILAMDDAFALHDIEGFAVPSELSLSYFQAGWALKAAQEILRAET
jgi:hypothetical protein